jgi:hypothetical protein
MTVDRIGGIGRTTPLWISCIAVLSAFPADAGIDRAASVQSQLSHPSQEKEGTIPSVKPESPKDPTASAKSESSRPTDSPRSPSPRAPLGMDAPLLKVDRFSDAAATLLRRSKVPGLPDPGEPIHLDESPFLVPLSTPQGGSVSCYNLDVRPAEPARFYVFYDTAGNYVLTQFPVVDVAPGDPGYNDVWDIWKVTVSSTFPLDNSVRDRETVERLLKDPRSGATAERTGALLNGPIVPEGSTARHKAENREGAATLRYVWYRGKRAAYIYFEQKVRIEGDRVPVGEMRLQAPGGTGTGPASPALSLLTAGKSGALSLATLPGASGYTPLRRLLGPDGSPLMDGAVNCPVVTP